MATYQNEAFAKIPAKQITQQQDWSFDLEFTSAQTGNTFEAQVRRSPSSTEALDITIDTTNAGATPPTITLSQSGDVTATMEPGDWVLDVWRTNSSGVSEPVAFRRVHVNARVTELAEEV